MSPSEAYREALSRPALARAFLADVQARGVPFFEKIDELPDAIAVERAQDVCDRLFDLEFLRRLFKTKERSENDQSSAE